MIRFGHLGNGITVWDDSIWDAEAYDYKTIAHISSDREINWYVKPDRATRTLVNNFVKTKNPTISVTQDTNVFNTKV